MHPAKMRKDIDLFRTHDGHIGYAAEAAREEKNLASLTAQGDRSAVHRAECNDLWGKLNIEGIGVGSKVILSYVAEGCQEITGFDERSGFVSLRGRARNTEGGTAPSRIGIKRLIESLPVQQETEK